MRFESARFLFVFLPSVFSLYFLILAAGSLSPAMAGWAAATANGLLLAASVWFVLDGGSGAPVLAAAIFAFSMATIIDLARQRPGLSKALLVATVAVCLVGFGGAALRAEAAFAPVGLAVVVCLGVAFAVDVYWGDAATGRPLTAALYLLQFPVLPAGPIVRYREFAGHLAGRSVGLGAFSYGVRRFGIGFIKMALIARTLQAPADRIFALPPAKLSTDAAWLGAVCFSLQIYFQFSGLSDMAIGLGRMLGLRYPENFRRPYTADSVRDFWRRWNITLVTWLRDYLYLPIAGRDTPNLRLSLNSVVGFALVGLWHGGGRTVPLWAVYSGLWLALEAVGLGARIGRLPKPVRHAYLIAVIMVGWVILRAETASGAATFLSAMAGFAGLDALTAQRYITMPLAVVLVVALVGAGPLVPAVSRWRVSLDVAAASMVMMGSATALFLWRGGTILINSLRFTRPRP